MKISEAFPTKYVAAADLQGQDVPVVISHVVKEKFDENEEGPVVYFQGFAKGLRLNKTNANTIADMYGEETDFWAGKAITLWPTETEFQGRMKACVRVRTTLSIRSQLPVAETIAPEVRLPAQPPVTQQPTAQQPGAVTF